jgi:hypothetical protein
LSDDGLYVVDKVGHAKKVQGIPKQLVIEDVYAVRPAAKREKCSAWVLAGDPKKLYLADADGVVTPCTTVANQVPEKVDRLFPSRSRGGHAWLLTTSPRKLYRVDRDQRVTPYPALDNQDISEILYEDDPAGTTWLATAADPKRLYRLALDGKASLYADLGGLARAIRASEKAASPVWLVTESLMAAGKETRLYRIGPNNVAPLRCGPKDVAGSGIYPAREAAWVWIKSKAEGGVDPTRVKGTIYLLDKQGQVQKTWSPPEDPRESGVAPIKEIYAVDSDEPRAWVIADSRPGLYLLGAKSDQYLPLESRRVLSFAILGRSERALVLVDGLSLFLVSADSQAGPPSLGSMDKLDLTSLTDARDGEHAWALNRWGEIYLLSTKGKVIGYQGCENVTNIYPEKDHAWVEMKQREYHCLDKQGGVLTSRPLASSTRISIYLAGDGQHRWIAALNSSYASGHGVADDIKKARLRVGQTTFDLASAGKLEIAGDPGKVELLDLQLGSGESWDSGNLHLSVVGAGKTIFPSTSTHSSDPQALKTWSCNWEEGEPDPRQTYRLVLALRNDLGSDLRITWPEAVFVASGPPWYRNKWLVTVAVFLGIAVVAGVAFLVLRPLPALSSWSPLLFWLLGAAGTRLPDLDKWLYPGVLLLLLGATLVACFGLGLVSPSAFRLLCRVEPFNKLSPVALRFGFVRRRLFAEYVGWLEWQLKLLRADAGNNEVYVPIPATLGADPSSTTLLAEPALEICRRLTAAEPAQRCNVLLQAPGGRGKSALLRQVVQLAVARFKTNPHSPLPVLCNPFDAPNVEAMIRDSLARHVPSEEAFAQQLLAGDFIVVVDGLTESGLQPDVLRKFIESEPGRMTCFLLGARPDRGYRQAVQTVPGRTLLVEPQRLTEENLEAFEKVYLEQDRQQPNSVAAPLSATMKAACRAADHTYLPLLVRLAVLVGGGTEGSVAEVYRKTFHLLLSRTEAADPELLDAAARMCVSTYWQNGYRLLAFEGVPSRRREVMQKLWNAGILVPHDVWPDPIRPSPRMLRFFHDSMQSYLTALGLFRGRSEEDEQIDGWRGLGRAAGDSVFRDKSDMVSETAAELFQMCLHVFIPPEQLRDVFRLDIAAWIETYERGLSKDDVLKACPMDLGRALELQLEASESAGSFLKKAVKLCAQVELEDEVRYLGILYGKLAPRIWQIAQGEAAARPRAQPALPLEPLHSS